MPETELRPEPEALLRGNTSGGDMRAVQQAQKLQILHHIADSGGREAFRQAAGQRARPHGFARGQIAFDHATKHLARAVVEFGQKGSAFFHSLEIWETLGAASIRLASTGGSGLFGP